MSKPLTLVQIEARGIQDYIFGSNNLQQNTGASEIIKQATTRWVLDALDGWTHNARWNLAEDRLEFGDGVEGKRLPVATGEADVEVIYAGGGNALLLFAGGPDVAAREFKRRLSRRAMREARDLRLQIDALPLDWKDDSLSKKHGQLRMQAARNKLGQTPNAPLLGLGVTAGCTFTGEPVVDRDLDGRLISRTVAQKLTKSSTELQERYRIGGDGTSRERLHEILPDVRRYFYEFTSNFDQFGDRGESSYIAVVHIDGNRMSERFRRVMEMHPTPKDNAAYRDHLYLLSRAIQETSTAALRAVVEALIASERDGKFGGVVPVRAVDGQTFLPFRPIVFGGDDATFVCEGRLGLALAEIYLKALAANPLPGSSAGESADDPLYARAGVAVVKTHFPFSRAYALAEQLCRSAKREIDERIPEKKGCIIDWHFSTTGLISPLDTIRVQEYTAQNGQSLLMRPLWVPLHSTVNLRYWQTWDNFAGVVRKLQTDGNWADHRNKIMALREALRNGPEAVKLFLQTYRQPELPKIEGKSRMHEEGWEGRNCGYFDAIEALDFYVPLQAGGEA